jgi:hypothetical protein
MKRGTGSSRLVLAGQLPGQDELSLCALSINGRPGHP